VLEEGPETLGFSKTHESDRGAHLPLVVQVSVLLGRHVRVALGIEGLLEAPREPCAVLCARLGLCDPRQDVVEKLGSGVGQDLGQAGDIIGQVLTEQRFGPWVL
jgi:hypothetical protein